MMNRPYRLFHGVAYPNLFLGENQPTKIQANMHHLYHDPSVRLSPKEVNEFIGKPICVEHERELDVGKIVAAWQDSQGDMRVDFHVYTDNNAGRLVCSRYDAGELGELSVGYEFAREGDEVQEKFIKEVSLCKEGFFDGARVSVAASKSNYKNNSVVLFKVTAAMSEISKDAAELLRRNDEMTKRVQELEAQAKAKDDALKRFEEDEKLRIEEYGKKQEPLLREVLAIQEEQWKEEHGATSSLPESHKEVTTNAFMKPEAFDVMQSICASANSWKRQKEAMELMRKQLAKQEEDANNFRSEIAKVNASHEKAAALVGNTPTTPVTTTEPVTASNKLSNLFIPAPSSAELELKNSAYPHADTSGLVQVNASNARKVQAVRAHAFVDRTPNSMRSKGSPALWAHLLNTNFEGVPTYSVNAKTTELEK